ncbi:MAG: 2-isopropylmalate synthase [Gemmatimonadales bacterium]|nr:2-isopropylmalate synthase [Gemmatimonadales bacterium]
MTRRITIFDTTLRDGEQAPGNSMTADDKVRLARQLDQLGVDVIEAGFPAASEGDFRSVRDVAAAVRRPVICALARCKPEDIRLAADALRGAERARIHTFLATSDLHLQEKLRITREEAIDRIAECVALARTFTDDVEWSAEDASRSDLEFLCLAVETAIRAGATTINLPDTVGYTTPGEYSAMFRAVRARVPGADRVAFSAHCHDDLGLAVANSLAAIEAGATQVECTINGIGERAGNAALEEIAVFARTRPTMLDFTTGIRTEEIYRTSQLLSHLTGVFPQPNKAIVGRNAFAHEAGIHQHGVMRNGLTYEIISPASVGIPSSTLVLGKHSGRAALQKRCAELGFPVEGERLETLYRDFTALADRKRTILDEDLLALLHERFDDAPEQYALAACEIRCGEAPAEARVRLTGPWPEERAAEARGDGPIHAAFAAVSEIVGHTVEVQELSLRSVTPGRDSVGQAFLSVRIEGRTFTAHAASTDIVEACVRALIHALNKAAHAQRLEAEATAHHYLWGV